jgi:hypothetical protein
MKVWLGSMSVAVDEMRAEHPELGLTVNSYYVPAGLPGWAIPRTTRREFQRFIEAWADNDPNGAWNPFEISEGDGALIYIYELGKEVWTVVGLDEHGVALYELAGWAWTE